MHMYTSSSDLLTLQKAKLSGSKFYCAQWKDYELPFLAHTHAWCSLHRTNQLPFLAHTHAWCSLHRTNQQDNSAYIVQRRRSKNGTSRHHRFGQLNGQRHIDPTSAPLVDAYSPVAPSSSSPAHIRYFRISSFIVFYVYYYWRFVIGSIRHWLLVHRDAVERHQGQARPFPANDKQALHRQSTS